jgi:tetratricopeptide (TPR) repeat protein
MAATVERPGMALRDWFSRRRARPRDPQSIITTIQEFLATQTSPDLRRVLEQHPELLSDETDDILESLAHGLEKPQAQRVVEEHRALLRRCREVGIERAFAKETATGAHAVRMLAEIEALVQRAQQAESAYLQNSDLHVLDIAVSAWQQILDHREFEQLQADLRAALFNNGGGTYLRRFWAAGHVPDLDRALACCRDAVELTPANSPNRAAILANLGTGLRDRYARTGAVADLDEAIGSYRNAVDLTPANSPNRAAILNNLSAGLRDHYARTGAVANLDGAVTAYREACRCGLELALEPALRASHNWGAWALERSAWQEGVEAYRFGMQAIASLMSVQLGRAGKESWLRKAQGMPSRAAYCLAQSGECTTAVVVLEQGRAYLLSEALERDRADLAALQQSHPAVYERYRQAAERIALWKRVSSVLSRSQRESTVQRTCALRTPR